MKALAILLAAISILTGCSSMRIENFKNATPTLTLEDYFAGRAEAWGVFEDRFGNVRRQFTVDIAGTWNADARTLTLVEDFDYADGETERRVWTLRKTGPTTYEGTAEGVVGTATGEIAGNAFNWQYAFDLPVGGSTWRVRFDDWMFLQPGGVIVNRATVTKWGIEIGRATIMFHRIGGDAGGQAANGDKTTAGDGERMAAE